MSSSVQYYQDQLDKWISRPGPVNNGLTFLEDKTKVKKVYLAYGEFPRSLRSAGSMTFDLWCISVTYPLPFISIF